MTKQIISILVDGEPAARAKVVAEEGAWKVVVGSHRPEGPTFVPPYDLSIGQHHLTHAQVKDRAVANFNALLDFYRDRFEEQLQRVYTHGESSRGR